MKRALFTAAIAILALRVDAQTINPRLDTAIYVVVDSIPKFPGGLKALRLYIDENVNKILKNSHPTGTIIAEILIEKDGKIKNTPGIVDGLPGKTDSLVISLLKKSPTWRPGIKNSASVRTLMKVQLTIHDSTNVNNKKSLIAENASELEDDLMTSEPWDVSDESKEPDPQRIYLSVEKPPEFPGGDSEFIKFLAKNLKWPPNSDDDVFGRIILSFIIEKDGSLSDLKVEKSLGEKFDDEAIRVLKMSPKWKPGVNNGWPVRVKYSLPINIGLSE